ncbi:hypothetical protein [Halopenitus persicus]|uniref:hypothetical protein n=1 Tax=Halopenitus persicus TaxID=1048396 RepID=UPI000BBB22B6|nr:hypothetical protein [Halopenitus persicus]
MFECDLVQRSELVFLDVAAEPLRAFALDGEPLQEVALPTFIVCFRACVLFAERVAGFLCEELEAE